MKHISQLMTHMMVGYPTYQDSRAIGRTLLDAGSDYIELQIPFSDPMADGPIIRKAGDVALANNIAAHDALLLARSFVESHQAKCIIVAYANTIVQYGIDTFCIDAKQQGVYGLIIPDIPFDTPEGKQLIEACNTNNICYIPVVALNTTNLRLKQLSPHIGDFLYVMSYRGVTGAETSFDTIAQRIRQIRAYTQKRIAVGFGIKTPGDVAMVHAYADIAVVGSAIVQKVQEHKNDMPALHTMLTQYIHALKHAVPGSR